jgi:hypothetical protein
MSTLGNSQLMRVSFCASVFGKNLKSQSATNEQNHCSVDSAERNVHASLVDLVKNILRRHRAGVLEERFKHNAPMMRAILARTPQVPAEFLVGFF